MSFRDPAKIGIDRPNLTAIILPNEQTNGPIETGIWVGCQKLDTKGWIAENQKGRRLELDAGRCAKVSLIDGEKKLDAFLRDVSLDPRDRIIEAIGAFHFNNTIVAGSRECKGRGARKR
jgi:hypothetical protein